jgi:hypothetical protein
MSTAGVQERAEQHGRVDINGWVQAARRPGVQMNSKSFKFNSNMSKLDSIQTGPSLTQNF